MGGSCGRRFVAFAVKYPVNPFFGDCEIRHNNMDAETNGTSGPIIWSTEAAISSCTPNLFADGVSAL